MSVVSLTSGQQAIDSGVNQARQFASSVQQATAGAAPSEGAATVATSNGAAGTVLAGVTGIGAGFDSAA
jgi:hypothetical protein